MEVDPQSTNQEVVNAILKQENHESGFTINQKKMTDAILEHEENGSRFTINESGDE